MSKLEILIIGYLDLCADKNGTEYPERDWRAEYLHKPGLIGIFASEHKAPGKRFAHFYPYEPDSPFQKRLRTSVGDLTIGGDIYTMTTKNSIYSFIRDDLALSETEKAVLFANSYLNPNTLTPDPDSGKDGSPN
jgi:hypothetical protein